MKTNRDHIHIKQAADILGVSDATIKNWIKQEYLNPLNLDNTLYFDRYEITQINEKIKNGKLDRLNSRANKRNSTKKFVPIEYIGQEGSLIEIADITNYIIKSSLNINCAIFYIAVNILEKEHFIYTKDIDKLVNFDNSIFKNETVFKEIYNFYKKLDNFSTNIRYKKLLKFNIPPHQDILGLVYQSIKSEGEKAKQGSYYTPINIVNGIVSDYINESSLILDPCCGTGQFLLNTCEIIKNPNNIYGFDIDPIAVFISKINLILKYKSFEFTPKIYHLDTLIDIDQSSLFCSVDIPKSYDLILTNPPWGLHFENESFNKLKTFYPLITSNESFSYFLVKSIELLKNNGTLSFILPESILNIKVHRDIRKYILDNTTILKITKLGRAFTNVFTNVIRLDLFKGKSNVCKTEIISNNIFNLNQNRFLSNPSFIFDIEVNNNDNKIIEKAYTNNYYTLKDNAEWALGVVTGNNKKFLSPDKEHESEEIYKGKDITKYLLFESSNFIKFEPDKYQQVAPIEKYRAKEKLIYKFISKHLVFAYDNQQKLTLNSANILIPKIKNYPIKVVLALLNSSFYQFIYSKKFNTIKVLRGNLEELPFPIFSNTEFKEIVSLVDKTLSREIDQSIIDSYIMKLFNISKKEQDYIFENLS